MNQLLDKFSGNLPPITSTAQAWQVTDYFNAEIEQIYSDMSYQNCNTLDVDVKVLLNLQVLPNLDSLNHYLSLV